MRNDHGVSKGGTNSSMLALAAVTLLVTASAMMILPTPASAFDLQGLVRLAAAHGYGGYRVGGGHRGSVHTASRHGHHSNDDDADTPPSSSDTPKGSGVASRHPENDRPYQPSTTSTKYAAEPSFAPSR
jgi:hypothetical protein